MTGLWNLLLIPACVVAVALTAVYVLCAVSFLIGWERIPPDVGMVLIEEAGVFGGFVGVLVAGWRICLKAK